MAEPVSSGLVTTIGNEVISNLANDLYSYLKGKVKLKIKQSEINEKLPELITKINNVRFVKTLWQVDSALDIESFYCDSNVLTYDKKEQKQIRQKIDTTRDFGIKRNIVIRGIAGQGKSIFLRHLCIKEFEIGKSVPIFIELRRIQDNETLLEHISRFFDILELSIDRVLFQILAKSGKFIFFLDGFDEIPEERQSRIVNELEYLASVTSECQFLVTSRPNTTIEMSSLFDVVQLDDLKGNEYKIVIKRLTNSTEYANALIKKIKSNKKNMMALLCTPLLVTLLILSYKSFQKLPEQLSDFYESIFSVLLQRHDGTKPGFIRKRGCSMNDNQYRDVFDALCFKSKKFKGLFINSNMIYEQVKAAMQLSNIQEDYEKYLKDIINITCLILFEGGEYRFIHNSVQEYYAASFIKNRPEDVAKRFYSACLKDKRAANQWSQELEYLSNIDKYRHHKYYLIPLLQNWMDCEDIDMLQKGPPPITTSRLKSVFYSYEITFVIAYFDSLASGYENMNKLTPVTSMYEIISPVAYYPDRFGLHNDIYNLNFDDIFYKMNKGDQIIDKRLLNEPKEDLHLGSATLYKSSDKDKNNQFTVSLSQVIDESILVKELSPIAEKIVFYLHGKWKSAYDYVNTKDSLDITNYILN
jgi:hypothetical protein